jgi:hypothetical protein
MNKKQGRKASISGHWMNISGIDNILAVRLILGSHKAQMGRREMSTLPGFIRNMPRFPIKRNMELNIDGPPELDLSVPKVRKMTRTQSVPFFKSYWDQKLPKKRNLLE